MPPASSYKRMYARYLDSLTGDENHPDLTLFIRGMIAVGTYGRVFTPEIMQEAKDKYGAEFVQGIDYGFSYWEADRETFFTKS